MKKLILFVTLVLVACSTPAAPVIKNTVTAAPKQLATETQTALPTEAPTSTLVPPTATETPLNRSTVTPQPSATCPSINKKAKLPLNQVFKDKNAFYHDARNVVLNFLNQGGDPKIAIDKLKEFNVYARTMDLTNDGVPEFLLPSGYMTIFSCQEGQFKNILDLEPSDAFATAVPLAIQDINQNGLPELLFGQVEGFLGESSYQIYEWDGSRLKNLLSAELKKPSIYIQDQTIHVIGQSNAKKGAFEGNWEIVDGGDGPKRIVIRAGVVDNYEFSSDLERSLTLEWDGDSYVVAKFVMENTPTPLPTSTPLPFSATCANRVPELRFQKPDSKADKAILDYLNAGGNPEQLKGFYNATIQDLNKDTAPEIILIDSNGFEPYIMMFTCRDGKYGRAVDFPDDVGTFQMSLLAVKDNNKNGFPEVFVKDIGCFNLRCGALYVVEWNGSDFIQRIKNFEFFSGQTMDYTRMDEPQDVYLKDLDNDGIAELIWRGEQFPDWSPDRWQFYPGRLATHAFKWDGENYTAQPVEYSPPEFRFQAVQDGDRYSEAGMYEKALQSYQQAITSNALKWWTEDLYNYTVARYGVGPCAGNVAACPVPASDPNERPILSAYALFRKTIVYLLMDDPVRAESTYQNLLTSHPEGTPGYKIAEMAKLFWDEYQSTQTLEAACNKTINFIKPNQDVLITLTGKSNVIYNQGIDYKSEPERICPFK